MDLPMRKHPRLKKYDYSKNGYYYITISTVNNLSLLSSVGRGLAPAEVSVTLSSIGEVAKQQLFELENRYTYIKIDNYAIMPTHIHAIFVLSGETAGASPLPTLTGGETAGAKPDPCDGNRSTLTGGETAGAKPDPCDGNRSTLTGGETAGAKPNPCDGNRPSLTDIVCAYKSLTTRICNQKDNISGRKIFQTSFYEKVIRNEKGYQEVCNYINSNPLKWAFDKRYLEEFI